MNDILSTSPKSSMNCTKRKSIYSILLVTSILATFLLTATICFSIHCQTNQTLISLQIVIIAYYFGIISLFHVGYDYLPGNLKSTLGRELAPFRALRTRFKLTNNECPTIKLVDLVHGLLLVFICTITFFLWYGPRLEVKNLKALATPSGYIADVFMALTLIPVSRNAFFARVLHISPIESIRYHQFVGNMFLLATFLHGVFVYERYFHQGKTPIQAFTTSSTFASKSLAEIAGVIAFFGLVFLRLCSLPIVRRTFYEFFLVSHLFFPFLVVVFSAIHANTTYIFSFPALVMYTTDLIYRFRSFNKFPKTRVTLEPCGITKIEVKDLYCKINATTKNGRFYNIKVTSISKVYSHPFSVARIDRHGIVSFYVDAGMPNTWKGMLHNQVRDGGLPGIRAIHSIEEPAEAERNDICFDGPFGAEIFNLERVDAIACFVTGIGLAGASQLIFDYMNLYPERKLYLYWSIRSTDLLQLSLFKEIFHAGHNSITIYVHVTDNTHQVANKPEDLHILYNRINVEESLAFIIKRAHPDDVVGVYTCGTEEFMIDLEKAHALYPGRILFQRESFHW